MIEKSPFPLPRIVSKKYLERFKKPTELLSDSLGGTARDADDPTATKRAGCAEESLLASYCTSGNILQQSIDMPAKCRADKRQRGQTMESTGAMGRSNQPVGSAQR